MKQLNQLLKNGATEVTCVPSPLFKGGQLSIGTYRLLISAGTGRVLVDFSKANWLDKVLDLEE